MNSPRRGRKFSFQSEKFTQLPPAPKADRDVERRFSGDDIFVGLPHNDPDVEETWSYFPKRKTLNSVDKLSSVNCSSVFSEFPAMLSNVPRMSLLPQVSTCRICLQCHDEEDNQLIKPCECKGTMGVLHRACLRKWVTLSGKYYCELCGYHYTTEERLPTLMQWIRAILLKRLLKDLVMTIILCIYVTLGIIYCIDKFTQLNRPPLDKSNENLTLTQQATQTQPGSVGQQVCFLTLIVVQVALLVLWLLSITYASGRSFRKYRQVQRRRTIRQHASVKHIIEANDELKFLSLSKDSVEHIPAVTFSSPRETLFPNNECEPPPSDLTPLQLSIITEQLENSAADGNTPR